LFYYPYGHLPSLIFLERRCLRRQNQAPPPRYIGFVFA
jgi:hypothetical protein